MKRAGILFLMMVMMVSLFAGCTAQAKGEPGKKAILVVSFGTSYSDTRELTIKATEDAITKEFPEYEVRRAFTSQIIIDKLEKRDNLIIDNPEQAFKKLKDEKFSEVIVVSLHVMNGAEFHDVKAVVEENKENFDTLVLGNALLTHNENYTELVEAMELQMPELADNEAVVFMGHGSHHFANATYAALDYNFKDLGHKNVFIGTVEGYPMIDSVMAALEEKNIEKVTLMPLMLVAGDHAENDMGGDEDDSWKTILKKAGYSVDVYMHGLGENEAVREMYIQHVREAIESSKVISE